MALLFMDSFDDRSGTGTGGERYEFSRLNPGVVGVGRTGTALVLSTSIFGGLDLVLTKMVAASGSIGIVGFAYRPTLPALALPFMRIADNVGNIHVKLVQNPDATLSVQNGAGTTLCTSTQTVSTALWQYLELKVVISAGAGSVTLRLNTVVIASATGVDTRGAAAATMGAAGPFIPDDSFHGNAMSAFYDDFYICDGSGSDHNDFLGDVVIEYLPPTAPGTHTSFTPVGVGSNWDAVNDTTYNDDTDYVASSNPGDIDTYLHAPLSGSPATILAVSLHLRARKEDVLFRDFQGIVRSGGTDYVEGTFPLHTADTPWSSNYQAVMIHDPATGAAWTVTGVNNSEIGVQLTA